MSAIRIIYPMAVVAALALPTSISAQEAPDAAAQDEAYQQALADQQQNAQENNPARKKRGGGSTAGYADEIVVTSQKREVESGEVPVAISTLSEETLDYGGIDNTGVTAFYTPNLGIYNEPTWSFISIRGIGSGLNAGFEQSVGIVYDGLNLGRSDFLTNALLDAQQIEILRGPAGIITGKNAVAGAYVVNSARPHYEWGGKYDIQSAGFTQEGERIPYTVQAAITGPLIEDIMAFRFAFFRTEADGSTYNSSLDRYQGDDTQKGWRASLALTLWEEVEVDIGYTFVELGENGAGFDLAYVSDDYRLVSEPYGEVDDDQFDRRVAQDYPSYVRRDSTILSMNAKWHINEHYTGTLIAGYASQDGAGGLDGDFGPAPIFTTFSAGTYDQWSIEFNLANDFSDADQRAAYRRGESLTEAGGWVMGAFYFHSVIDGYNDTWLFPEDGAFSLAFPIVCRLSPTCPDTITDSLPDQLPDGSYLNNSVFYQETDSYAAFFAASLPVPYTERWMLSFGTRYIYEQKYAEFERNLPPAQGLNLWTYLIPDTTDFEGGGSRTETAWTARASVQYFPYISDVIEANVFATAAKGWKAGGFNSAAGIQEELEYQPEDSWTMELGIKTWLFDKIIGTAITGFYSEFNDLQTSTYNGEKFVVTNAANAFSQGLELELIFEPFKDVDFSFGIQGSLLEVRFIDYKNGPCIAGQSGSCDLSGKRKGGHTPWQTAMGLNYTRAFFQTGWDINMGTSLVLQPESTGQDDGDPKDFTSDMKFMQFRIGIKDPDDLWHLYVACADCLSHPTSGGFDVPLFAGTHAHVASPGGPFWQVRAYGRF